MSRHVLTSVLLDFGNSLWSNDLLREELPALASSDYKPTGRFGIGFYSVFMLGDSVSVVTKRFERKPSDTAEQWRLSFEDGLDGRPALSQPTGLDRLKKHGTRVSIKIGSSTVHQMLNIDLDDELDKKTILDALVKTICAIAPGSDVRITALTDDEKKLVIEPNDWMSITDQELIERLDHRDAPLVPLFGANDEVIGRLALSTSTWRDQAVLIFNGITCGQVEGLTGILQAQSNNIDAKRSTAAPAGSLNSWVDWAHKCVAAMKHPTVTQLARIHPIIPEVDLPVWTLSNDVFTLSEVSQQLSSIDHFYFHDGEITHEGYDEMGSDYFDELVMNKEILSCPDRLSWYLRDRENRFPWFLDVDYVSYGRALEEALRRIWGDFERKEDVNIIVGEVRGVEISRDLVLYTRV